MSYDEIHVIFDRIINDKTMIENTKRKKLLSHTKTKDQLTVCFSNKLISHYDNSEKDVSVAYRDTAVSNHINVDHLKGNQEEADT